MRFPETNKLCEQLRREKKKIRILFRVGPNAQQEVIGNPDKEDANLVFLNDGCGNIFQVEHDRIIWAASATFTGLGPVIYQEATTT